MSKTRTRSPTLVDVSGLAVFPIVCISAVRKSIIFLLMTTVMNSKIFSFSSSESAEISSSSPTVRNSTRPWINFFSTVVGFVGDSMGVSTTFIARKEENIY